MAETTVTISSTLTALVAGKRYATLRDILITMNPAEKQTAPLSPASGISSAAAT